MQGVQSGFFSSHLTFRRLQFKHPAKHISELLKQLKTLIKDHLPVKVRVLRCLGDIDANLDLTHIDSHSKDELEESNRYQSGLSFLRLQKEKRL